MLWSMEETFLMSQQKIIKEHLITFEKFPQVKEIIIQPVVYWKSLKIYNKMIAIRWFWSEKNTAV